VINIGIIGTGFIGHEHARAISLAGGAVRLIAAADVDSSKLSRFCDSSDVDRSYSDAGQLIRDPEVELVVITTPPTAHEELVVAALENGKYVFCEKPLAHSLASAARVAQAESRHPGRLAVSYQMRYEPSYRRLVWLCANGWIGHITSAIVERHSYIPHANVGRDGWWGSWKVSGGGVLLTQLIHEMDILLLIMGRPSSVAARMDTRYTAIESEDYVDAILHFESGATARCIASVNSGRNSSCFKIRGSDGSIALPRSLEVNDPKRFRSALDAVNRALPETRLPSSSLFNRGLRFVGRKLGTQAKPSVTPHGYLYQEIARSIERRRPLPIPPSEAVRSLELCFAAYESAITGEAVKFPLSPSSLVYEGVRKQDYDARKSKGRPLQSQPSRNIRTSNWGSRVRIGLIGLDTSHATSFASILHDPDNAFHIPGARVVAAYPGGSNDMPISISRVAGFTNELKHKYGIPIVDTPEDVADVSDIVCILASDGRSHPALLEAVAGRCSAAFIDKPFAISTSDARRMFADAESTRTCIFATSAFRYADGLMSALQSIRASGERIKTCTVRYWLQIQETQGRYFWYGIHASEMLLTIMGKGASAVEVAELSDRDAMTVWHEDGRQSSLIGSKIDGTFSVSIETGTRTLEIDLGPSNSSLAARVLAAALDVLTDGGFPKMWSATQAGSVCGGRSGYGFDPDHSETLEVIGLLEAAQRSFVSKQRSGVAGTKALQSI
jgi:predicted dehydrogenase